MHPGSLSRWVKEWSQRDGANVASSGQRGAYRMPITYRLVGRGWRMTQDAQVRAVMLDLLPRDPKPWLVVVGKLGSTCYTSDQARDRVTALLLKDDWKPETGIHIFYVGDHETGEW